MYDSYAEDQSVTEITSTVARDSYYGNYCSILLIILAFPRVFVCDDE